MSEKTVENFLWELKRLIEGLSEAPTNERDKWIEHQVGVLTEAFIDAVGDAQKRGSHER